MLVTNRKVWVGGTEKMKGLIVEMLMEEREENCHRCPTTPLATYPS